MSTMVDAIAIWLFAEIPLCISEVTEKQLGAEDMCPHHDYFSHPQTPRGLLGGQMVSPSVAWPCPHSDFAPLKYESYDCPRPAARQRLSLAR